MTETLRVINLDQHVGRVIAGEFPTDDEAYLLCLTSQELSILRQHTFPYAHWRTRFVNPIDQDTFECVSDADWALYHQIVEDLEDNLWGCAMPCSDIKDGLLALAAAIAAKECENTTVNCGGGSCGLQGYLGGLTPGELMPQDPVTQPDPGGDPPEGFENWDQFYTHKCKAAHFLWQMIRNWMVAMEGITGAGITAAAASPIVAGILASTAIVFPPAAFVAFVVIVVAVGTLSTAAFIELYQAVNYWDDNKESIVCALYQSGSAAAALDVIADEYENAIEFIVWSGVLAPLGPALAAALSGIGSEVINTNMVNVLFNVAEDVLLPDAECICGGYHWHFDTSAEGWLTYHEECATDFQFWHETASGGADPSDSSPGRLALSVQKVAGEDCGGAAFYYDFNVNRPVASASLTFEMDALIDDPSHSNVLFTIFYLDDSYDQVFQANPTGWNHYIVPCGSGNYGKAIKRIWAQLGVGVQTDKISCYFDNASLA